MKLVAAFFLVVSSLFPQQLSVRSATAHRVELSWTGATAGSVLERKTGTAPFEKVTDGSSGSFTDEKIEAYATYKYRVRTQGASGSKEVTVGPPPLGVNVVARCPKGLDPATFGAAAAMTLDENGDPAIAFVWVDPNGDKDRGDTAVYFSRWNRATYAWNAPVKVDVVGDIGAKDSELLSLAFDQPSGIFAAAYPKDNVDGAFVATSHDGGATWQSTNVATDLTGTVSSTAVTQAAGHWFAAIDSNRGLRYLTGGITDTPSQWKSQSPPGDRKIEDKAAIATDANGKALIAYWAKPDQGDNDEILIWSPDSGQVTRAADSNGQDCGADLRLDTTGGATRLLMDCDRDPKDDRQGIWYTALSGGTWSTPIKLPVDGPRSTSAPLALAVDSKGRLAAVYSSNSGSGDTACGYPVVARSNDGVHWIACGPGKRAGGDFEKVPSTVGAIFTPDNRLNILWHEEDEAKYGIGLDLWRE